MRPVTHNSVQVKKMNMELVRTVLKTQDTATKASVAKLTTLSVATCGTLLNELVARGEAVEMEAEEAGYGRPAKQYRYNPDFGCIACILVQTLDEAYLVSCSIVNLLGDTVMESAVPLKHADIGVVTGLLDDLLADRDNVYAIGVGIPGVVADGVIGVCDVPSLAGQNLGAVLEARYELPVIIENDMNMTVYGFYRLQNFNEDKTFAVVTFPENHFPGAGFIVDGRILSGNTKFGGELSFLPFGVTREEQLRLLHTEEGFIRLAAHALISVTAIINPVTIAITGDLPQERQLALLREECLKIIPGEHMPELMIRRDTRTEYMQGLATATLESLAGLQ